MTRRCVLTGTGIQTGNNVSNSNQKTKRIFAPNLQKITLRSDLLNRVFQLKLTTRTIRTITKYGSLDEYLLHTKVKNMTSFGAQLKRKLRKIPDVKKKIEEEAKVKKAKRIIKKPARIAKKEQKK